MRNNIRKTVGKTALWCIGAILLIVLSYLAYVLLQYDRIADNQILTPEGNVTAAMPETGMAYTIATQNIGFGAYTPDFTFFMDGGSQSRAASRDSVIDCVQQAAETLGGFSPDFLFIQEVDNDATRSFHVDEQALLLEDFPAMQCVRAQNYHSAYLFYPFLEPHGASNSGIMTFSRYPVAAALRRQLPISTGLNRLVDLDRCYTVSRIPMENGRELILYNVHLSAYSSGDVGTAQLAMLLGDMQAEYEAGNYCICGGDFNRDFPGDSVPALNNGEKSDMSWVQPFPAELLPADVSRSLDYPDGYLPTCRNCDIPYETGNFTVIVDGFLVSSNVTVLSVENIQTGFSYSDHNPVVMRFLLEP